MLYTPSNMLALDHQPVWTFKRRESIPLRENTLWHIRAGAVRLFTWTEEGTPITLGFWGVGDLMGQPLICIQPCRLECLMNVEAVRLKPEQCRDLHRVMLSHLHQTQELIRMRQGNIRKRLKLLLTWLMFKFGSPTGQGQLIQLRLTHQEIADAIGTTRVTVTRLMQDLERSGEIQYSRRNRIVLHQNYPSPAPRSA